MNSLAVLAALAAAVPSLAPGGYDIEIVVCDGDPAGSVAAGTVRVLGRDAVTAHIGNTELLPIRYQPPPVEDGGLVRLDETLPVRLTALLNITPRRTPAGLDLEVRGTVHGDPRPVPRATPPAAGAVVPGPPTVRAVLVLPSGKTARHTIATRSPTDQTWLEVTARPAE